MKKENRAYYDEFAAGYEGERGKRYHAFLDESEVALARPYCEGRKVLEVGCGTGLVLARLAAFAGEAHGVDLSPGMLEKARARGLGVSVGSATELPFADGSFDCVVSFKVLAHVEQVEKAVHECCRVVRPGGHVVLEFYNRHSLRRLVKAVKPRERVSASTTDDEVYTRYDTLAEVRRMLPGSMRMVKVRGIRCLAPTHHFYNLPLVGRLTVAVERALQLTPLSCIGGFLVVVAEKGQARSCWSGHDHA